MTREGDENFNNLSDEDLALALQAGNVQAFDELVRRHQGRVYAVAYRMTGSRDDALDVAQESLFKAYRKVHTWQPTGLFLPWLLRLTTNQSIDLLRRKKRRRQERYEDAVDVQANRSNGEPASLATEHRVIADEIDERVQASLSVLSPAQRTVFVLRHYQGLQLAEIAPVLGCTVGSVKVHLFRALKKLRNELSDLREVNP